jgi:hypothetical protein
MSSAGISAAQNGAHCVLSAALSGENVGDAWIEGTATVFVSGLATWPLPGGDNATRGLSKSISELSVDSIGEVIENIMTPD